MGNYRNFRLATYFVAQATANVTREELEKQLSFMEKYLRIDKVYLEPWRGLMASEEQVNMCREVLSSHGIEVSGGLTTVISTPDGDKPKQRLFDTFCYNDAKMRKKLKEVSAFMGSHFDEFIIDDFFFTSCSCPDCIKARDDFNRSNGIKSGWRDYRLSLLKKISSEDIIEPAKKANPNCRIIIKYPNWAESYQEAGYNPKEQRELFDMIYTGTETRDPVTTDQHLPRYLSFSLMTYFENMWKDHNGGGWFDNFDMHITEHYLEQAYLTAFSKPKELMMFCFQSLYDNIYIPALGYQLDKLDVLLDNAGTPVGISCYLPDNCQGEDNVQDYLGMNGIPIVCTPYFPMNEEKILLTRSSAFDNDILEKLKKYLSSGKKTAVVTSGFWDEVKDRGYEDMTSIRPTARKITSDEYRVEEVENICTYPSGKKPVTIPVVEFRNNSTWALVKAFHEEESYALLLRDSYCDSSLLTVTVPDAYPDFYRLPAPVLNRIRNEIPVNGVWLEAPSRISIFIYDNDTFIIYPYVMEGVQREIVRVHIAGAKSLERIGGKQRDKRSVTPLYIKNDESVFEFPVLPGEYLMFRIER